MGIVALLMEYKEDRFPGCCGPGDTLRLAHALRHPSLISHPDLTVISTLSQDRVAGLIPTERYKMVPSTVTKERGSVNPDHLGTMLDEQLGAALDGARVIHSFIGEETYLWRAKQERSPAGRKYTRQRVDSSKADEGFMLHSKWVPPAVPKSSESVLAAFIRKMKTSPKWDTPDWFYGSVRACALASGYRILWCGSVTTLVPRSGEEKLYPSGPLLEQIRSLASRASCAVGVNSGGLDLAAAAGLPILRIWEWDRIRHWGKAYNSYLACATCVGIGSRNAGEESDRDVMEKSLVALMANRGLFNNPRHVILPSREALKNVSGPLEDQLIGNEIAWLGVTNLPSTT